MFQRQEQSTDHIANLMFLGRPAQLLIYNICPAKGHEGVPAMCPGSVVTGGIIYSVGTQLSLIWQTCKYFPGAELSRGPRTGSPSFPARDDWGSLPLQRRLHLPHPAAQKAGCLLAVCLLPGRGDTRCGVRCRPRRVQTRESASRRSGVPARSQTRSPFLEMNSPARLSGSPFLVLLCYAF